MSWARAEFDAFGRVPVGEHEFAGGVCGFHRAGQALSSDTSFMGRSIQPSQRGERGFHVVTLGLPIGEPLLVLGQNVRRDFLREVRVGQLLLDLGGLGLDFFQFLFQPRFLGLDVNQPFQRQEQIAQLGAHRHRVFRRLIIRVDLDRLGIEQQFEYFDVVRRQFARRFEDEFDFFVRGDIRRAAQIAALCDQFVPRLDVFFIAVRSGRNAI